jgi:hypothetical protein
MLSAADWSRFDRVASAQPSPVTAQDIVNWDSTFNLVAAGLLHWNSAYAHSIDVTGNVHGATSADTANMIVRRGAAGEIAVGAITTSGNLNFVADNTYNIGYPTGRPQDIFIYRNIHWGYDPSLPFVNSLGGAGNGAIYSPGTDRTQSSFYVTDTFEPTVPHSLFKVHRTGPVTYDPADNLNATIAYMDVDASRASQANQVSGAWLFVNVGIPTGSNTPNEAYGVGGNVFMQATGTLALAEGGLFGVAINGGNGSTVITSARDATFKAITKSVGTITNAYGAYFEDQTVAGTENAAIRFQTTGMMSWNNDVWLSRINVGKLYLNGTLTLGALSGVLKASTGLIGGNAVLNDLSDLNAGAPAGGNVLSWDAGTSKWVPIAPAGGSSVWTDDGTNIYPNNLSRKVGIGTTTPSQLVDITGGSIKLDVTTHSSLAGIIYKGSDPFISDFNYGNNGTVTTAGYNIFVGVGAGNLTMGATATVGYQSSYNLAIGPYALHSNTTGGSNLAFGVAALYSNTTGDDNLAFGVYALYSNTTGGSNLAIGPYALNSNTTGGRNLAFGVDALHSNTTGGSNLAFGVDALQSNTTGGSNLAFGVDAGHYITDGATPNLTPDNSIYLGNGTRASADGETDEVVIGSNAIGNGSHSITLGHTSITKTILRGNVGIGITTPTARLHLAAGVATAFGAPFKLTSGVNLTSPEDGALEYDGSYLYFTIGSTRSALVENTALSTWAGTTNITTIGTQTHNLLFTDATYDIGANGATRPQDLFLSRNITIGGVMSAYDTIVPSGNGGLGVLGMVVPVYYYAVANTGAVAQFNVPSTNVAGMYRISMYLLTSTAGTGTLTVTWGWTDQRGARTVTTDTLLLTAGTYANYVHVFAAGYSSTYLTCTVSYTLTGTADVSFICERLA